MKPSAVNVPLTPSQRDFESGYRVSGTGMAQALPMTDEEKSEAAEKEKTKVLGFR